MSRRGKVYRYLVEGECEKALVKALKDLQYIVPGSIEIINVVERTIPKRALYLFKPKTTIILIFDTDTNKTDTLQKNVDLLRSQKPHVQKVVCIPQNKNLEDELSKACSLKDIKELFKSKSKKDFKRDLLQCSNLSQALVRHKLDMEKLWDSIPTGPFQRFKNGAHCIKKKIKLHGSS